MEIDLFSIMKPSDIRVYLDYRPLENNGQPSFATEFHVAPYEIITWADVILVKLALSYENSSLVKSICLPAPDIVNKRPEYALTAGWGENNRQTEPLQMGPVKLITNPYNKRLIFYTKFLYSLLVDNKTLSCKVGIKLNSESPKF